MSEFNEASPDPIDSKFYTEDVTGAVGDMFDRFDVSKSGDHVFQTDAGIQAWFRFDRRGVLTHFSLPTTYESTRPFITTGVLEGVAFSVRDTRIPREGKIQPLDDSPLVAEVVTSSSRTIADKDMVEITRSILRMSSYLPEGSATYQVTSRAQLLKEKARKAGPLILHALERVASHSHISPFGFFMPGFLPYDYE